MSKQKQDAHTILRADNSKPNFESRVGDSYEDIPKVIFGK